MTATCNADATQARFSWTGDADHVRLEINDTSNDSTGGPIIDYSQNQPFNPTDWSGPPSPLNGHTLTWAVRFKDDFCDAIVWTSGPPVTCTLPSPCGVLGDSLSGFEQGNSFYYWWPSAPGGNSPFPAPISRETNGIRHSGFSSLRTYYSGTTEPYGVAAAWAETYPPSGQSAILTGWYFVSAIDPGVKLEMILQSHDSANSYLNATSVTLNPAVGFWQQFTVAEPYRTNGAKLNIDLRFSGSGTATVLLDDLCIHHGRTKSCNVTVPAGPLFSSSPVSLSTTGHGGDTANDRVRLWVERQDSLPINPAPAPTQVYGGRYYYELAGCESTAGSTCTAPASVTLPEGSYFAHCDAPNVYNNPDFASNSRCSGNPFCLINNPAAALYCQDWLSCSTTDYAPFTVSSASCTVIVRPTPITIRLGATAVVTAFPTPGGGTVSQIAFYSANPTIAAVATPTGDPTSPYSKALLGRNIGTTNLYAQCFMGGIPYPTTSALVNVICPTLAAPVINPISAPACGSTSTSLSWSAVTGANGYNLVRRVNAGPTSGPTPISVTSYTDPNIACNRSYIYQVQARTSGSSSQCTGVWSASSNQIIGRCVPVTPAVTTTGGSSIVLNWPYITPTPGGVDTWYPAPTSYSVRRLLSDFPTPTPATVILPVPTTTLTDNSCGRLYSYEVRTTNACGSSLPATVSELCQTTWWQTEGAGVACVNGTARGTLPYLPPTPTVMLNITPTDQPTPAPGAAWSRDAVLSCKQVNIQNSYWNTKNWITEGVTYTGFLSSSLPTLYGYNGIVGRLLEGVVPSPYTGNGSDLQSVLDLYSEPTIEGAIYFKTSNVITISSLDVGTKKFVLIVDNSVSITDSTKVSPGGLLVILAQGDITIGPTVGDTTNPKTRPADISGLFVADGRFLTGTGLNTLHIKGTVAGMQGVFLQRQVQSNEFPAEFFEYDPEQVYRLPQLLRRKKINPDELIP